MSVETASGRVGTDVQRRVPGARGERRRSRPEIQSLGLEGVVACEPYDDACLLDALVHIDALRRARRGRRRLGLVEHPQDGSASPPATGHSRRIARTPAKRFEISSRLLRFA